MGDVLLAICYLTSLTWFVVCTDEPCTVRGVLLNAEEGVLFQCRPRGS